MKKYLFLLIGALMTGDIVSAQNQKQQQPQLTFPVPKKKTDTGKLARQKYYDSSTYVPQINTQQSLRNNATMSSESNVKGTQQYNTNSWQTRNQQNTDYYRAGTRSNMNKGANRDKSYYRDK